MNLSNIEILNNVTISLHRYIAPILYIFGNLGSLFSAIIFFKRSWRKNVCVFYFLYCLLINVLYMNSTMLGSIFTLGFNINAENSSAIICKFFYYISYLLSALLPNVFVIASIDRLLISSENVDTRLYSSKRLAYFSMSISTLFWIIFYFHALIKINVHQISPSVFICYYDTSGFYFEFISYSTLIIIVGLAVVLIILSMMTLKNVRQIHALSRHQRKQSRSMHRKDFQLLRCLYAHDIVYIIFNIFIAVYYVYAAATKNQFRTLSHQALDNFFLTFGTFIHHIPYCSSFFIFIGISKAFRYEMKQLVYKISGRTIREKENRNQNPVVSTIKLPA